MSKSNKLENAHRDIEDWARWIITHIDNSAIGYGKRTVEARMMSDGVVVQQCNVMGAICPDVMMRPDIARVDRIIPQLPLLLYQLALCKYLPELAESKWLSVQTHTGQWIEAQKIQLYRDITSRGQTDYYKQHRKLLRVVSEAPRN